MIIQYTSRGCLCHPPQEVDASYCETCWQRRNAFQKESELTNPCAARGCIWRWLACFGCRDYSTSSYSQFGSLRSEDLRGVPQHEKYKIMNNSDLAVDSSKYLCEVKFTSHIVIPYVIVGCGNLCPEKAKHAAYMALTQWSSTRDKRGHKAVTMERFKNSQFIEELEQF